MFFAAKEAVERKARERGRREGIEAGIAAGRPAERQRINDAFRRQGLSLPPEISKILSGDAEQPAT